MPKYAGLFRKIPVNASGMVFTHKCPQFPNPARSSLIRVCTVCSDLSVRKFRVITVALKKMPVTSPLATSLLDVTGLKLISLIVLTDDTVSQRSHSSHSTSGCSSMAPQNNHGNRVPSQDLAKRRRESGEFTVGTQTPPPQPQAKRPRCKYEEQD